MHKRVMHRLQNLSKGCGSSLPLSGAVASLTNHTLVHHVLLSCIYYMMNYVLYAFVEIRAKRIVQVMTACRVFAEIEPVISYRCREMHQ